MKNAVSFIFIDNIKLLTSPQNHESAEFPKTSKCPLIIIVIEGKICLRSTLHNW